MGKPREGIRAAAKQYNSQFIEQDEFADASGDRFGLDWYDFAARSYDPQIGRWMQPDPMMQHNSPYLAMSNNPIIFTDPMGLWDGNEPALDGKQGQILVGEGGSVYRFWNGYWWYQNGNPNYSTKMDAGSSGHSYGSGGSGGADVYVDYDMGFKRNIQYSEKTMQQMAHISAEQNYSERISSLHSTPRPYVSYGWSNDQNVAASKFMLNALSFTVPIGNILRGIGGVLKIGASSNVGRVFWSGGNAAKNAALEFAKANGLKTLEMTFSGKLMNALTPFMPRSLSGPIWDKLSLGFANGASGAVNVFHSAAGVSLKSTWRRVEYEVLKEMDIIYHIVK